MAERRPRPFLTRLAVAVACVYGPFVVAPFLSDLVADPELRAAWFWSLPVLPGLLAGRLAGPGNMSFWLSAGGATALWIGLTIGLTARSWATAVLSLLFAAGLAAVTVHAFRT